MIKISLLAVVIMFIVLAFQTCDEANNNANTRALVNSNANVSTMNANSSMSNMGPNDSVSNSGPSAGNAGGATNPGDASNPGQGNPPGPSNR
jgi:hypothetical protein